MVVYLNLMPNVMLANIHTPVIHSAQAACFVWASRVQTFVSGYNGLSKDKTKFWHMGLSCWNINSKQRKLTDMSMFISFVEAKVAEPQILHLVLADNQPNPEKSKEPFCRCINTSCLEKD